jgi:PPOX class probable F420-dependent enzyme
MNAGDLLETALARDLLDARLIAKLATHNPDGAIHLVAMWFLWEDGALLMPTSGRSRKARNAARDSRGAVMIDDSRGGLDVRGITMTGRIEIVTGAEASEIICRAHRKYLGDRGLALDGVRKALASDDVALRFVAEAGSSWDLGALEISRLVLRAGAYEPLSPVHPPPRE